MRRIPTLLTAAAAVLVFGAATAPAAGAATTAHPGGAGNHCTRGMTHKNGNRDCGKHKGGITACKPNRGNTTAGTVKGNGYKGNKKLPPCPPKTGTAPSYGHPNGKPAPGAGPGGT